MMRDALEAVENARASLGDVAATMSENIEAMEKAAKRYEARNPKKAES